MSPLGDAVRFVNGKVGNRNLLEPIDRVSAREALRREIKETELASNRFDCDLRLIACTHRTIEHARRNPHLRQLRKLVLHQSDERRDHDHGAAFQHRRRQLIAERLASAGGHHDASVAAAKQTVDDALLQRPKGIVAPIAFERRKRILIGIHGPTLARLHDENGRESQPILTAGLPLLCSLSRVRQCFQMSLSSDVNLWPSAEHALEYLRRADTIPHRVEGEATLLEFVPENAARILDLGSGGGRLLGIVRAARPNAQFVALDFSPTMLDALRNRFRSASEVSVVAHDLAHPLPEMGNFDCVVSSFAIHHLPHERKRSLYREIFEVLAPGGVFCNLEHVASPTVALHREFLCSIDTPPEQEDPSNKLLDVETQLKWLREIGFIDVDCHWKWRELALLAGRSKDRPAVGREYIPHLHAKLVSEAQPSNTLLTQAGRFN